MKKFIRRIAVTVSACLVGFFLFTKSVNYVRNNELLSLLTENVEALSAIEYFYVDNTGQCGVILRQNVGTQYEYWYIRCRISYEQMVWALNGWKGNDVDYCNGDQACKNTTFCSAAY